MRQCICRQEYNMRLICFWCAVVGVARAQSQDSGFYAPQTYKQSVSPRLFKPEGPWGQLGQANRISPAPFQSRGMFTPSDVTPQGTIAAPWRPPAPVREQWPIHESPPTPIIPKVEPWRAPYQVTKEQQANIIHHKQALTSEGAFRFEYASDNGLSAGEQIEPDGSRVGAYQYKDPSGQLVTLKYRAGKDGFQILEGSHIPKSPEPVPPPTTDNHYVNAYEQQRRAYELQQQYNQQRAEPNNWRQAGQGQEGQKQAASGGAYFTQNWRQIDGQEDDGQYRENDVENKGPHSFGEGYAFSFKG